MHGKWVKMITVISVISCLVWIVGLGITLQNYFFASTSAPLPESPPASELTEVDQDGFHILALGDSLTRGLGDAEGKGYIGYLMEHLDEKTEEELSLFNLAISGQRAPQLVEQVKQQEVQRQLKQADIILITIGGNDLFRGGQTLMDLNLDQIKEYEQEFIKNINTILTDIRSANTDARIFLIGLYNPFIQLSDSDITSKVVLDWNYKTAEEVSKFPKAVFVPTYDLFQLKMDDYLYTDQFHPNTEGYKVIAERVAGLITGRSGKEEKR
jgi:lysophospholipase L1-like esterase